MSASHYPGHGMFLPYLLNRATTLLNDKLQEILNTENLTLTHWRVLAFLATEDGLTIGALAEVTMTEQSTLSRSLGNLERQGYVARHPSVVDSRVVHVHLSAQGRTVFEAILEKALRLEADSTEGISTEELELVRSVLLRITSKLNK